LFTGNRLEIKQQTSEAALTFVADYLEEKPL
jgi:hypothetical protein